ncbi:E3 ubiquitin-protein ligase TRIM56-like isoform X2 [Magallana gigas]
MASVTSTITEEFLTCSICFEIYKDPKTLPCLHSFCKDCINNLRQEKAGKNSIPCPICREVFQLPTEGANDLKTNFCLKNLIDFVTSTKEVKKICSFCRIKGENIDATYLCLTCNDLLCPECGDHRHRSTTLTLNHRVVSLAEVTAGKHNKEIRSKQQIPCSKHEGEDLRFFCETCDVPVCRDCIVLGHQNHKCLAPTDARKHMDENLNSLMDLLNQKIKTLTDAKEKVVTSQKKIETEKKKVKENLERHTSALVKKITDSKKAVEKEFDQFVKSKQDILHQQEASIESERKLLNETYSVCSNIFRCGSDIEVLSMKTEMKGRLSKLQYSNDIEISDIKGVVLPDIQFCNEGTIFKMIISTKDKEPSKPKSHSNAVVGKEHKEDKRDEIGVEDFHDQHETKKPCYTSVAWVDENTIAVVDKGNQKLKLISRGKSVTTMVFIKNCLVVTSFKDGVACRSDGNTMQVFNRSLELRESFSSVLTLMTCHPQTLDVCWVSGLKKICTLRSNDVKEIAIYDPNTDSNLHNPMFGHMLLDGMFAVSDWDVGCVFLIRKTGCVLRRKYFDSNSNPGSISSDSKCNLYVCDFQKSVVVIFAQSGETLHSVQLGAIAPNPRSIALRNQKALITNGKSIVEIELK